MLPTVTQFPKPEPRFYNGIWLGKDTATGEPLIGTYNKIVRARTIRTQIVPHKYNQQLLDCVHAGPWKTPASALPTPTLTTSVTMPAASKALASQKDAATIAAAEGKRQSASQSSDQRAKQKKSQHHQWLHHRHIRNDQHCQHHHTQEKHNSTRQHRQATAHHSRQTGAGAATTTEQPKSQK